MTDWKRPLPQRFRASWQGLLHGLRTEANFRIHAASAIAAITAGVLLQISRTDWLAVIICIGGVAAAECFNTAIERLADRVQPELDPMIGQAKDCAAAGVLCVAIGSAVVGGVVFVPRLIAIVAW